MPIAKLPSKFKRWFKPKRFKVCYGGRGGAKSYSLAEIAIYEMEVNGKRIGFFREFQNSIDDSVYSLLCDLIREKGLESPDKFTILGNKITHANGAEGVFKGLARNIESIKSMHGFDIFWIEEAQTISYKSLEILTPTLRKDGSEVWLSFNRMSSADPVSQRFIKPFEKELLANRLYEDDDYLIIEINHEDNPWFTAVLEQERRLDEARLSAAEYRHKWKGDYNDTVADAIIPVDWFDAAIDAHKKLGYKPRGQIICAHDPSDEGKDDKGFAARHGSLVIDIDRKEDGDAGDGMDWALDKLRDLNADVFTWDCDGLGISLKRQVETTLKGSKIAWTIFKGSESPAAADKMYQSQDHQKGRSNKDTFKNKRAQCYWKLRDRFYATYRAVVKGEYVDPEEMIFLDSGMRRIDELRAEVCRIPRKKTANGLIQIMSKEDMLKLDNPIESPNMADSLMMTMIEYNPLVAVQSSEDIYVEPMSVWD